MAALVPLNSKVCRMMLVSRSVLTQEQQRAVCEGDLAGYMDHCPLWCQEKDNTTNNWMDLDNRMTETIALVQAVGAKYFLLPEGEDMQNRATQVEKLCFSIMNTMVYLINKICFAPNSTSGNDFDPVYARSRFIKKYNYFARQLGALLEGPLIQGDTLPIHADYLLYACLADLKQFVPQAFQGTEQHPKIASFMERFWSYHGPLGRWFKSEEAASGEYIRPAVPHIFTLLDP